MKNLLWLWVTLGSMFLIATGLVSYVYLFPLSSLARMVHEPKKGEPVTSPLLTYPFWNVRPGMRLKDLPRELYLGPSEIVAAYDPVPVHAYEHKMLPICVMVTIKPVSGDYVTSDSDTIVTVGPPIWEYAPQASSR